MYYELEHQRRMTEIWRRQAREKPRVIRGYTSDQWGRLHNARLDKAGIEDLLQEVASALHSAIKDNPHHHDYYEMTYARVVQARADLSSMSRDRRPRRDDPTLPLD
jgi:hypothetical protein